ncbi:hypothetical protein HMPREF9442_01613 [Paraprevotella xylaniphila YIT 11841]|uniref:Uncharacterized protein n=1 Tax=Paraprevotella xylaniphila YIT 11841 TaxID=762982 RepID=F3QTU4_9BACT|nr:hypothetical protein HMPREF9442_01613 [Paraprevotella xylaniphila YIT 11841]
MLSLCAERKIAFSRMNFRSAEIDLHICRIYAEKRGISCMFMRNFTLNYGL